MPRSGLATNAPTATFGDVNLGGIVRAGRGSTCIPSGGSLRANNLQSSSFAHCVVTKPYS